MNDTPRRCDHALCRHSIDEADWANGGAMTCPHGFVVCWSCAVEEICAECAPPATDLLYGGSAL